MSPRCKYSVMKSSDGTLRSPRVSFKMLQNGEPPVSACVCNRRKCAQSEFEFLLEQTHLGGSTAAAAAHLQGRALNQTVLECLNPRP